jgi:hypothetical protein
MKTNKLFGMITLIVGVMLIFSFTACDNGNGGGGGGNDTRDPITYTGTANSVTYTLKIEDSGARAVLTPTQGDKYTLTVGTGASAKTSTGSVNSFTGGVLTLAPSAQGAQSFTATVSGTSITAMTGSITWDNGTSENAPTFTGGGGGGGTADTFTLNNAPATGNGVGAIDIFIVSETLSATSGYPAISKAIGHITSGGNTATITWGASKNATYNFFVSYFIQTTTDYVGKFKNGVVFTNGSATLDWNTMETATEF